MELEEKVAAYVQSLLEESFFLVDVQFHDKSGRARLVVSLDGDRGVSVDYCASISRQLSEWLEEQNLIQNAYVLEVSSPGVGQPLKMLRQYYANIGRTLRVDTTTGVTHKGKLVQVSPESILLEPLPVKKTKKAQQKISQQQAMLIPFAEIAKAVVEISFD
ncbi:MAG: ribosome maturation factor RimP [Cytophagales bacterium]|nr:ribosome maturation factor RimP [Bernardetiaceae bacterium]MDW8204256.1 ribosome maturation factor RimP [Cytophagales bacterium]